VTRFEQMGAAVAQDRQGVIVQAARLVPCGSVVLYASMPGTSATSTSCSTSRTETRRRLVTILWEHVRATERLLGGHPHLSNRVTLPIRIAHDRLGRPHLLLGEHPGPAISFSTAGEDVWAALCGDKSDIGIDVAGSAEFQEGYPMHRVFHARELQTALELARGDSANAAALLWSVKEAVAKALGCAFHLVDPRDIHVYPSAGEEGGPLRQVRQVHCRHAQDGPALSVRLTGKALVRFPMADRQPIAVRSLPQAETWLSIAAVNWRRHRVVELNFCEAGQRD
jgi:phosphopantetheinyl transferase